MNKYKDLYKEVEIPNWNEYFMKLAVDISTRSTDSQTKHGCVLVDMNNHIIGTGYNAPARKVGITKLPNVRPEKYKFFIHSEINALLNMTVPSWNIKDGIKVYVTGIPCLYCLSCLINSNTREIVYQPNRGWSQTEVDTDDFNFLIEQSGIKLTQITI